MNKGGLLTLCITASGLFCACLAQPGVVTGAELIEREVFFEKRELGDVRSISAVNSGSDRQTDLFVGGRQGAAWLTRDGSLQSLISFDRRVGTILPIDVESDGVYEFMDQGGGWQPVSLLDDQGRTAWIYPAGTSLAADQMTAGDLDGDGRLEFVVGMNGNGGLHLLDARGRLKKTRAAVNVFSVQVLDTNGDGRPEIVHSHGGPPADADTGIWICNAKGEKMTKLSSSLAGHFSVLWPRRPEETPLLLALHEDTLQLLDFNGKLIRQLTAPGGGHAAAEGTWVDLQPGKLPFLAVVRTIKATARVSRLYLYDPTGELVYHEVLPSAQLAVAAFPSQNGLADVLLVGAGTTVWEYKLRHQGR